MYLERALPKSQVARHMLNNPQDQQVESSGDGCTGFNAWFKDNFRMPSSVPHTASLQSHIYYTYSALNCILYNCDTGVQFTGI